MPTYFARKAGNINAADVWATTPSGTASNLFPTFTNADVLMANSFAITVNVNTTVAEVRNDATGGATGGGSFTLSDNITLAANIFGGNITSTNCVNANPTANGAVNYIVGNITGGNATLAIGLNIGGSTAGTTVFVTGNVTAGGTSFSANMGISMSVPNLVLTGNVTGGGGTQGEGIRVNGSGNCTVTGTVTGGAHSTAYGIRMSSSSSGSVTVNGIVVGGSVGAGINNETGAPTTVTRAVGNGFGGSSVGLAAAVGVSSVATQSAIIVADQLEFGALGQSPVNGRVRLRKASTNVAVFNFCDTAGSKTLIDATQNASMPAATDVRSGVSYASGAQTGSCAVPAASSVASGVPVGSGFGTAVLTPAAIRAELATELARIDTTISSRLSPSGTLATVTTLTNAPTSVTPSDIWSHASRTITGGTVDTLTNAPTVPSAAEIATAVEGSLLNEADGQAVLNAIVGAIGNTNLSEVSLVAAVRADLERSGGKLDSIPTTAAPTAAQNATAVWGASTKEITGGTVTNLTNAPASVTPSDIWSHSSRTITGGSGPTATEIRQEMDSNSTKLSAIKSKTDNLPSDPADQSLLEAAIAGVTAPSAGQVASQVRTELSSELAKVAALNTERLANVATTAIVGNLIAQANS